MLASTIVFLGLVLTGQSDETWEVFKSDEGGFTVEMPQDREQVGSVPNSGPTGRVTKHELVRQPGGVQYWIIRYECESMVPLDALDKWMDFACDDAVKRFDQGGKVTKSKFQAGVLSGQEFIVTSENGLKRVRGRTYLNGPNVYIQVAVSSYPDKALPDQVERFFKSFRLGPPTARASSRPGMARSQPGMGGFPGFNIQTKRSVTKSKKASMPRTKVGPAAKGALQWGKEVDPDGDVRIKSSGSTLTMHIPPTPHVLAPNMNKFNAPRVVVPVDGNFVARVQVDGPFSPGPKSTTPKLSSRQAGGVILWKDSENHVVLQRRTAAGKEGAMNRQVIFDEHASSGRGESHNSVSPDGSMFLRLERQGTVIRGFFSGDGQVWRALKPIDAPWATGTLQVGVMAVNTSTEPHVVTFDNYSLTTE
jgi:regulation of enolase protein 1 (concanavalin A-like superfamily)